tara:strand:- start:400 stop:516 length:117 start_codon:yes stop_codon:yes gene_type:complete
MKYSLFLADELRENDDYRDNNLRVDFDDFKAFLNKLDI